MKHLLRLLCVLSVLGMMTACSSATPSVTVGPQPTATVAPTDRVVIPTATLAPTATLTPTAPPANTYWSQPLYFLSGGMIWLLLPGASAPEPIATEGEVDCMDVWSGDNRIAYGTTDGRVYAWMPGQGAVLLHNVQEMADAPVKIHGVSWSSDGTKLAYTVAHTSGQLTRGYPSHPSGLWVFDMQAQWFQWLLSNHYAVEDNPDVIQLRTILKPSWSPDDAALLLRYGYWESNNHFIFEPMDTPLDETHLHDLAKNGWGDGFWTRDGQAVLISAQNYGIVSDLVYVSRLTKESKSLIAGETEGVYVADAQELPGGIVFISSNRLYLGNLTEQDFQYAPVGPASLCNAHITSHVEWDSAGHWGVLVCKHGANDGAPEEVHVISLAGENLDITPYLVALSDIPSAVLWGKNQ